ncbi:hypothetical protein AAG565_12110 [Fontimonas sp. SYSU GA230001]|uniref:hypothetical protein n=1 Tax=Fontimonas sp. SYSU GA230001 TaxID=3142450 RepID=UPI0032B46527
MFGRPLTIERAWDQVVEWLSLRNVWIPHPTARHGAVLGGLLAAAHAVEHGLELCSTDADFARSPAVRWRNPLKSV